MLINYHFQLLVNRPFPGLLGTQIVVCIKQYHT